MSRRYPVTILMYHSIDETPNPRHPHHVTPAEFERQMAFVARRYRVARLTDLLQADGWGSERRVIVTFDDGIQDFKTFAFPVLQHVGIPVTMFVPSQWIGKDDVMNANELLTLEASGLVDIGSHTANHVCMGRLSADRMREEAALSRSDLETLLGHEVVTFAYPFGQRGDFTPVSTAILAETGYRLAVTTCWGTTNSPAHPLTLRRIATRGDDTEEILRAKIEGAHDWKGLRERASFAARCVKQSVRRLTRSAA